MFVCRGDTFWVKVNFNQDDAKISVQYEENITVNKKLLKNPETSDSLLHFPECDFEGDNDIEPCLKPTNITTDRDITTSLTSDSVEQPSETDTIKIRSDIGQEHSTLWTT